MELRLGGGGDGSFLTCRITPGVAVSFIYSVVLKTPIYGYAAVVV